MGFDWMRRRPCSRSRRSTKSKFALAVLLMWAAGAAAALPEEFSARYEVTHSGSGITLGEAQVHYERIGADRYRYSSLTRPVGITSLFYDVEIQEVSEGRIIPTGYRPDRYDYDRRGKKAREASLKFDWAAQRVVNEVEGKAWDMPIPKDTLDRMVSQLQLMHDLAHNDQELVYRIADGGKLREYELQFAGREKVSTVYGQLEAIKVTRQEKKGNRATTFWAAPALEYLPVKISHREKGDNFVMKLEELRGFNVKNSAGNDGAAPRAPLAARAFTP